MQTRHRLGLAIMAFVIGCGTMVPAGATEPRPMNNAEGIPYVSGGVGLEERSELNAIANRYNLHLMFAAKGSGKYLASVRVEIRDARGNPVLNLDSDGPWVFAQLPPGNYVVEATAPPEFQQRSPQRQKVHIDASHQSRLRFYWR